MSHFAILPSAILHDPDCSADDIAILVTLYAAARRSTKAWIASIRHNVIATRVKRSRTFVCRRLHKLAELGYLTIEQRYFPRDAEGHGGGQRSNLYILPPPNPDRSPASQPDTGGVIEDDTYQDQHYQESLSQPAGQSDDSTQPTATSEPWAPTATDTAWQKRYRPDLTDEALEKSLERFRLLSSKPSSTHWRAWLVNERASQRLATTQTHATGKVPRVPLPRSIRYGSNELTTQLQQIARKNPHGRDIDDLFSAFKEAVGTDQRPPTTWLRSFAAWCRAPAPIMQAGT